MPFDDPTRNELQKVVGRARDLLVEEFTFQCQRVYGIQPDGSTMDLAKLEHLPQEEQVRASLLRDRIDHLAVGITSVDGRSEAVARMVREQGFTLLNRLCALRMCEERGLLQECVRSGFDSKGFRLYDQTASQLGGDTYCRYALFLQLLFDELSVNLGILFDRFALTGLLFPGENALKQVLALINTSKLSHIWADDEAIGWVYQYFNSPEERKAMREASAAPRSSRELAVRNQFFTPRYVVEFLTDNSLGRIWYEMRKGDTALKDECRYLLREPNETVALAGVRDDETDLSPKKWQQPLFADQRSKKDPRDLRVLDPACGSGHFLLYAFDLLEVIYKEAWGDRESPKADVSGRTLREDYSTLDELNVATPRLIVEHNLHGIDIDPRAAQIAALSLWLRAQKTWNNLGSKIADRKITNSNVVAAEPMPGEEGMRFEFTESLRPKVLGQLVNSVFDSMKLVGETGSLLKIEEEIKDALGDARKQWLGGPKLEQAEFFPELVKSKPQQQKLRFDVEGVTDEEFWEQAEDRILDSLRDYAERAESGNAPRRRLFAEDAARGFSFIDLCRKRYDVVLMNPPFGSASLAAKKEFDRAYPRTKNDVYAAFVERGIQLLHPQGLIGAITSRTGLFLSSFQRWREEILIKVAPPVVLADLGYGVLDSALVEVAAYCLQKRREIIA
jgi:hypothetical protein